jgi:uncharacterized membrane protein YhiD involved in acid resistance
MDEFWHNLENLYQFNAAPSLEAFLQSLLLAFVLGQFVAWAYIWTHSGLSYSRSFTQMLVVFPVVIALVMVVIANNLITAFGMIGALALIRFRNVLKDTRDTVFIFISLVVGMACGLQRYATAIIGALFAVALLLSISWTDFGSRGRYDGYLRFSMPSDPETEKRLQRILTHFCRRIHRVSIRQMANQAVDFTYQVRLRDRETNNLLIAELEQIEGIGNVSLIFQEEMSEV